MKIFKKLREKQKILICDKCYRHIKDGDPVITSEKYAHKCTKCED